jgi:uncharacterized protein YbbC (DUF1343 family)
VTDRTRFEAVLAPVAWMREIYAQAPDKFLWRQPPYEYETVRLPIDLLTGDPHLREGIDAGRPVAAMERSWSRELAAFADSAERFRLYR